MKTDPFADLPESPAKTAAYAVQARMSGWITQTVDDLKKDLAANAETAVKQMTAEVTRQFDEALASADQKLMTIQQKLAALRVNFVDANLKEMADNLDKVIKEHEKAVEEQRKQVQG